MSELTKGFRLGSKPFSGFSARLDVWKNTCGLVEANGLMSTRSRGEGRFLYWFNSRNGFENRWKAERD